MNCFRFANVMNNTKLMNFFNSDKIHIANIKTQHSQIITTITNIVSTFEHRIKKIIVANHKLFTVITFSRINSFAYINSRIIQHL